MSNSRESLHAMAERFQDDNSLKKVFIQGALRNKDFANADVDRHVHLFWFNEDTPEITVIEILHLSGSWGSLQFEHAKRSRRADFDVVNETYLLGYFTRAQRDQICKLAKDVQYNPKSHVNGCRVWMRDLLDAMMKDALVKASPLAIEHITSSTRIPLPFRRPEPQRAN
ncbi:hypothetical protein PUNSTDRAFT_42049 [Punctularia strigosozonata HHB-11173 SS5]|uniref:uncharacterized protein n=1 Tax=Punctularia strigosozonata (strain HHB-11173) TaxID=741275 RepID=UPI0004417317|nr:uncharacterized protein PUNSTDRAFT_42049 [Punctularia strigosozonata HHB-11173 SS5]EIN12429.1 hypothetical protein PUNSTDRAFT_42049 [Punctularia strigosozonata HHB-11173 SS5]